MVLNKLRKSINGNGIIVLSGVNIALIITVISLIVSLGTRLDAHIDERSKAVFEDCSKELKQEVADTKADVKNTQTDISWIKDEVKYMRYTLDQIRDAVKR